ncbi:MAG: hypothetical protein Q7R68_10790 [Nitrospirales bacterium]|nr:hypothetical protein [Nitrospirales bacterium]
MTIQALFDPRGVTSPLDLCPCGEPRQPNNPKCWDCVLDEQEAAAPYTEDEEGTA